MKTLVLLFLLTTTCFAQFTFTTLDTFDGANGATPTGAPLLPDSSGNLWGMTTSGGANNAGSVFEISDGVLSTIYSFCSLENCADGSAPMAGLIIGVDGNFWGTTSQGGANSCGTMFEMTSAGVLTTLYSFCATPTDGANPYGNLGLEFLGRTVYTYGTTFNGGTTGGGTIFAYDLATNRYKVKLNFCQSENCADGSHPYGNMVPGWRGLVGALSAGGAGNAGGLFTSFGGANGLAHSFCLQPSCIDGDTPGPYLFNNGDYILGVTLAGGSADQGVVFEVPIVGGKQGPPNDVLYNFCSQANCADGGAPEGGLVGANSAIYGTTTTGGANNSGTLFHLSPNGQTLQTVHSFCDLTCADGSLPGSLIFFNNGLYGTASAGGASGMGTVYSVTE